VTIVRLRTSVCVFLGAAAIAAACGQDSLGITSPSSTASDRLTGIFSGTVPVQGSRFYSFTLSNAGTVELTLASLSLGAQGSTLAMAMGLGSGTPNGTDCDLTNSVNTVPGLTIQLRTAMAAGTHCVKVFDIGNLTTAANFAVRIETYSTTSPLTIRPPTTETFSRTLAFRGAYSRSFSVASAGIVKVTLTSVGPPSLPIGLGLGIPGGTVPCTLSTSLTTLASGSPQISQLVDPGSYCVSVYDVGNLTIADLPFSVTIEYP